MSRPAGALRGRRAALGVLSLVLFLSFVDNTIVTVALADVQTHLHAGVSALQWVVGGYALSFASLMLVFGTLGDLFGRRRLMAVGIALFAAGSVLAAAAPNAPTLIAGRVVMGIGAAASEPGTLSMIRHLFPEGRTRAEALGVWAAVSGLALAVGPVIGGVLVAIWSFRAVFVFNIVLAIVALAGLYAAVPEVSNPVGRGLDGRGFLFGAAALATTTFATIGGETAGYGSTWVIALYCVGAAAALAFVAEERRSPHPVLDLRYFRLPGFAVANVVALTATFSTFAVFFFVPLYLVEVGSQSGFQVAVTFLPLAAAMIAASALTGRWVARVGAGIPMALGCAASGLGVALTDLRLTPTAGPPAIGWCLAIAGAGLGVAIVPVTSEVLQLVPANRSGMASSATNTSREVGAVAGTAIFGSIINGQLTVDLTHRLIQMGVPAPIRTLVITGVSTGGSAADYGSSPQMAALIAKVEAPAYAAFRTGLDVSLRLGAVLLAVSAVLAVATVRTSSAAPGGGPGE